MTISAGQLAQKLAADKAASGVADKSFIIQLLSCREFWWAGGLLAIGTVAWLVALSVLPVSTAYPILSLSFVFTTLGANRLNNEHVSRRRWFGVVLISLGAALVTAS